MKYIIAVMVVCMMFSFEANASNKKVPVPVEMKQCKADAECIMVETLCNQCCGYVGINKNELASYQTIYQQQCVQNKSTMCDCIVMNPTAVCHKGVCIMEYDL
jgi:hypothetical protein